MTNRFKTLAVITAFLMLTACSDSTPDISEQNISQDTVQTTPEYKIIEDEVKPNIKRTVEVELSSRTDEESLKALAEKIYALSNAKVERTFIGYRIANEDKNQAFWATTHYNPDLDVRLLGKNLSDYETIKNTTLPEGEILGSWMVSDGLDYKTTAYTKDGKTYMQMVASTDGNPSDKVYELSQSDKGTKLQSEGGKRHNEYFIIDDKGNLEFWNDDNGNYYTPNKI